MELEVSTVVHRSPSVVWNFYAVNHVENHPRWDPDLELENTTDGPVRVGTVIRRKSTRFDPPTEGIMEVIEFEPEEVMSVRTQDGSMVINGFARFSKVSESSTRITIGGEFPGMDDSMADTIQPLMERSIANIKKLIEADTPS